MARVEDRDRWRKGEIKMVIVTARKDSTGESERYSEIERAKDR